ncbi:MAG: 4-alpha-glucanotransferase [Bacteroidota bacterium]
MLATHFKTTTTRGNDMQVTFRIHFMTQWGQRLFILGDHSLLQGPQNQEGVPLHYLGNGQWELPIKLPDSFSGEISYKYYILNEGRGSREEEFGTPRSLHIPTKRFNEIHTSDTWRSSWEEDNVHLSAAFLRTLTQREAPIAGTTPKGSIHRFQLRAGQIARNHGIAIVGGHPDLGNWDESKAVELSDAHFPFWSVDLSLKGPSQTIEYKFLLIDKDTRAVIGWENRDNRRFVHLQSRKTKQLFVHNEEFFAHPHGNWRGSGLAVPVFSLRSKESGGVGEFTDLRLVVDWAKKAGQEIIQILPINDTVATHTWIDSYPYAAISVFALHPLFMNMKQMGRLKDQKLQQEIDTLAASQNTLEEIDYEAVMANKSRFFKALYDQEKRKFLQDKGFNSWFEANQEWLLPYAVFSALRDIYRTANFRAWEELGTYDAAQVQAYAAPESETYDDVAIHYFIQYHLHLQLSGATDYARAQGISLKGDIPIGIYRHSVDAWMFPHLYHMDKQAGAPPDDFAVAGQNWRFPTYNWEVMAQNDYAWWKARMKQLANYFDLYRIDHILGFFRIWQIPGHAIQGIMGQFNPSMPLSIEELQARGIWFDYERLVKPYIRWHMLPTFFGDHAHSVMREFLDEYAPLCYHFKPEFDSQRKIEAYIDQKVSEFPDSQWYFDRIKNGLLSLHSEVIFFEAEGSEGRAYDPRIAMHFTYSYRELDAGQRGALDTIYNDYFYHRHEGFWRDQAMVKLPALKEATDMLICGEDLGMVPDVVPGVMRELGILSLEIQRMPKDPKRTFGHPADAPYLSVVSTSTHDMPTLRGWWEADPTATQQFYNEILGEGGGAPYFCEPWIAERIIEQHLFSPAMWAIFPLQDLLAIDGSLRRDNPGDEQINVPANPEHYWRYRMHIHLEDLIASDGFNAQLKGMVKASGRLHG